MQKPSWTTQGWTDTEVVMASSQALLTATCVCSSQSKYTIIHKSHVPVTLVSHAPHIPHMCPSAYWYTSDVVLTSQCSSCTPQVHLTHAPHTHSVHAYSFHLVQTIYWCPSHTHSFHPALLLTYLCLWSAFTEGARCSWMPA